VEALLRRHGLDYELRWHLSGQPFLTQVDRLVREVAAAVEQVTGLRPELSTGGGTSDGRFIAPAGVHVVEFGAVNDSIHKVNERIPLADIETLQRVYLAILERLLL
jgi:succinyl-diaminopimelate desuccinylase